MRGVCGVVVLLLCACRSLGDETASIGNSDSISKIDNIENIEVPDSALMFLDGVNVTQLDLNEYYSVLSRSRKKTKQGKQNATTATTEAPEEETDSEGLPLTPCKCSSGVCNCCTGYVLGLLNQKACMRITYHPGDFAFDVAMSWNDRVLYENSMSGKNPKPICISPPRLSNMKVCAKFYNVFFPGRNFHFCLAMNGQWQQLELFNMAFNCLRMGANGIAMIRPEDNGGISIPNPQGGVDAVIDHGEDDIEEYDENLVKSLFGVFEDDDR
ncbi:hypothetical protein JYU34_003722 [Plutella xylostella]|uniref:DUF4773 domain-containing protein n=1 Tax=Plutella xylostella TaxID=51655 RepID=A0ABQ7R0T2_PLUXY|nr:hypothetical protein JYU34_003722 [Plutella xylostella]